MSPSPHQLVSINRGYFYPNTTFFMPCWILFQTLARYTYNGYASRQYIQTHRAIFIAKVKYLTEFINGYKLDQHLRTRFLGH